ISAAPTTRLRGARFATRRFGEARLATASLRRSAFSSCPATTTSAAGTRRCTGNRSDQLALAVEDVERQVLRRFFQQVRDRRAAGGPNRVARCEQVEIARRRHRGPRLPDRRDVVEDVE